MSKFLTQYQLNFWERILAPAFTATIQLVALTTIFGTIFGFLVAVVLLVTNKEGILPNKIIYNICSFLVNVIRSLPFLILMIFILPVTRSLVGTSIGVKAAAVPLIVSATAFIAKLIENAMQEVDKGLIEAMKSFGISEAQVVFRVMFSEALPSIISGVILAMVAILGSTAVAGTMGAGGIGNVAIVHGYQRFNVVVMSFCAVVLVVFVELIERAGKWVYRKLK
jgi:D-methionine transport system permease protein